MDNYKYVASGFKLSLKLLDQNGGAWLKLVLLLMTLSPA